jgi:hypothetical protein
MKSNLLKLKQLLLTLFVLIFCSIASMATNYYVSAEGNDENPGTSPEQAWRTLEKVNSHQFSAGDQILFNRGDIWRGTLNCNYSGSQGKPITYGAYGEGPKPIIYGSEVITGWTQYSGNIYKASVTSKIGQVFLNGTRIRVARYPNEGYLTISSVAGTTSFTSNGLDPDMNYAGATWFGRTRYYFAEIRDVVSSSSKSITLNSAPNGNLGVNQGFILMNKLEFLNQPGEWYYDKDSNEFYLWTPEGDSPENYLVTGSVYANGININRKNYLRFNELDIREQDFNGVYIYGCTNITIENSHIANPDQYGISAEGSGSLIFRNNEITRANGGGMWLWTKDSHITDNKISNIGIFNEIGLKGNGRNNGGSGAEISGENNKIEYNIIENTNYNGLFYRGKGTVIQYNLINNTCLTKDDGGGIYTNTGGTGGTVRYNIVLNSIGNPEGFSSTRSMAEGIYIDEIAENVLVEYNTVQNTGDAAIKLHNVGGIKVENNTIMTARYGIWCNKFVGSPSPITNNIVYMTTNKDDYEPRSLFSRVGSYNTKFDYNKYFNPTVSESTQVFRQSTYMTFAQWKTATGQDANSTFNSTPLAAGETVELVYNASKIAKKYSLNDAVVKDLDGNTIASSFTLQPFTSVIITGKNLDQISEVADTIPPVITSFSLPSQATSLTVDVLTFAATDDMAVAGYFLTGISAPPAAGDAGWTTVAPTTYTFAEEGTHTIYAWAKDAAGNVSEPATATVNIYIPDYSPTYLEYLFEENSGTTVIDTNGSNDGIIVNEALRVEGVKGMGLEFSGLGYIDAGQSLGGRIDDEITISAWIKPALSNLEYQGIMVHGGQDSISFGLFVNADSKSIVFETSGTSAGRIAVDNVSTLWDGNWHHVLATYNGSEKIIYLDNTALATVASTGNIHSAHGYNLLIGAGTDEASPGLLYHGKIDEVRVFNYALTSSDVSELFYSVVDTTTYAGEYKNTTSFHCFPNPFKRYLNIELSGPRQNVTIDIFNNTGLMVRRITDTNITSGRSTFTWDGTNENGVEVLQGIYFIRLKTDDMVRTIKVSKLK